MSQQSSIEWTEATWNPLAGCAEISPGCTNCYAAVMAHRLEAMGQAKYKGTTRKAASGKVVWTGKINLDEAALQQPLRKKKPTTYFVNSMSDLFHEDVPDEFIDKVFAVMALCPQHTFQVLTKRAKRMRDYLADADESPKQSRWEQAACDITSSPCAAGIVDETHFPLPNVWCGVSAENQKCWDERVEFLRQVPAAIRFVSAEPLLEPIDAHYMSHPGPGLVNLDWVIVGGESGPGARVCNTEWIRSIVKQCKQAGVPCFVKQLGGNAFEVRQNPLADALGTVSHPAKSAHYEARSLALKSPKGGDPLEWPEDLRVRELPIGK